MNFRRPQPNFARLHGFTFAGQLNLGRQARSFPRICKINVSARLCFIFSGALKTWARIRRLLERFYPNLRVYLNRK